MRTVEELLYNIREAEREACTEKIEFDLILEEVEVFQ